MGDIFFLSTILFVVLCYLNLIKTFEKVITKKSVKNEKILGVIWIFLSFISIYVFLGVTGFL